MTGWPGIQIEVADEWVTLEIATCPELAEQDLVARLARLINAVCADTGWACVYGETGVTADAGGCVHDAARASARWGEQVRDLLADNREVDVD